MAPFLITTRKMFIANILRFRAMEFCHSFGSSVSLACIETKDENEHLKEWLLEHGKTVSHSGFFIFNVDLLFSKINNLTSSFVQ
jgi:hypothetical protein